MRYLRMLSNSMLVVVLSIVYVVVLVLHLNPHLLLHPAWLAPLLSTVGLFYVVHLTAFFYILFVFRQLLAREVFSPAWISVGVLVWLGAMASAVGATLMWRNLRTFALVVDILTAVALEGSVLVLVATTVVCMLLAIFRCQAFGARAIWALLFVVIVVASIVGLVALRG